MPQIDFRTYEKKILRGLLSEDKLEQLQELLRDITDADDHKDLNHEVINNMGRLSEYRRGQTIGTASNDELRLLRNQIRNSFANIIDTLPDEIRVGIDTSMKTQKLMTEQRFKSVFLVLLIVSKLLVILFTLTIGASGLTNRDFSPLIFTQLPVLLTFISIFYLDFIQRKNDVFPSGSNRKVVNNVLKIATFALIPIFLITTIGMINNYSANAQETEFHGLITWLLMIESMLGIFVGSIIYGLFKEK
jgi:preprotein translocase subunit SecG